MAEKNKTATTKTTKEAPKKDPLAEVPEPQKGMIKQIQKQEAELDVVFNELKSKRAGLRSARKALLKSVGVEDAEEEEDATSGK